MILSVFALAATVAAIATAAQAPTAADQKSGMPEPGSRFEFDTRAVAYTAKIEGGMVLDLDELKRIAHEKGTVEFLYFDSGEGSADPVGREVFNVGSAEYRFPGFFTSFRALLDTGAAPGCGDLEWNGTGLEATMTGLDGVTGVDWVLPRDIGVEPLVAKVTLECRVAAHVYTWETLRVAGSTPLPEVVRVDIPEKNGSIIQVIDYGGSPSRDYDPGPFDRVVRGRSSISGAGVSTSNGLLREGDEVSYNYSLTGLSFDYDSLWQPPGNSEPGGWPFQLRLNFGAGFDIASHIGGYFNLDGDQLAPGEGAGDFLVDLGAEMWMLGAIDIYIIDPIIVSLPYVPYYDLRVYDDEEFDSFLLGSSVEVRDSGFTETLFAIPLIGVPWFFEGGLKASAKITLEGSLAGRSISTADGAVYTAEGESKEVDVRDASYHTVSAYNEFMELTSYLWIYPRGYVKVFGFTWHYSLPLGVEWEILSGRYDMTFNESPIDFDPGYTAWRFDIEETIDGSVHGVESKDEFVWVAKTGADERVLFKYAASGELVESYDQPPHTGPPGWADLASDQDYIYAGCGSAIDQIDPADGSYTGVSIPGPLVDNRALARDPAADHFWTGDSTGEIVEFDRSGAVFSTFSSFLPVTGLAWDDVSPGAPWLWAAGAGDSLVRQFDPISGEYTGIDYTAGGVLAGGGDFDRFEGEFIGVLDGDPASVFGMRLSDGFTPDTVYLELLDLTTDKSYVRPGEEIDVQFECRYENTINTDDPADISVKVLIGAANNPPGYTPRITSGKIFKDLLPGIFEYAFTFAVSDGAPVDSTGIAACRVFIDNEPLIADTLTSEPFTIGINPDAGSVSGLLLNRGTGRGVPGMDVDLYGIDGKYTGRSALTDSAGCFVIEFVDPGSYCIETGHEWYESLRDPEFGEFILEARQNVDRDTLLVVETGMAYIELKPDTPSQFEISWYPTELDVSWSITYLSEYGWVEDLEDDPVDGFFFAFEDENLGWYPGYIMLTFQLPAEAEVGHVGLEWNGIALKYMWYNVFAYYKINDDTIWNMMDKYIYHTNWLDYTHLAPGDMLDPGEQNMIFFGATEDSDWSEHIVDTMRWNFHGYHPG